MKLISMTEFVLQEKENVEFHMNDTVLETGRLMQKVFKYAEFLRQPLTLGMFVPCDEDGNILKEITEPNKSDYWSDNDTVFSAELYRNNLEEFKKYQKAKEKVLFEGFCYKFNIDANGKKWEYVKNEFPHVFSFDQLKSNTVESLLTRFKEEYMIELTPSALKQIGL